MKLYHPGLGLMIGCYPYSLPSPNLPAVPRTDPTLALLSSSPWLASWRWEGGGTRLQPHLKMLFPCLVGPRLASVAQTGIQGWVLRTGVATSGHMAGIGPEAGGGWLWCVDGSGGQWLLAAPGARGEGAQKLLFCEFVGAHRPGVPEEAKIASTMSKGTRGIVLFP